MEPTINPLGMSSERPVSERTRRGVVVAGDCFYAGFLAHLIESGSLDSPAAPAADQVAQGLAFGNRVTPFSIQRAGCQPPWRHEL